MFRAEPAAAPAPGFAARLGAETMRRFSALTTLNSWLPTKRNRRPKPGRVRLELLPLEDRIAPAAAVGAGTGLVADYYSDANLSALVRTRVDPGVNFDWGNGSPNAAVPADHFSVRWTGQIQAQYSETYTFSTVSAGEMRLWVNGQEIINDWTDHAKTTDAGTITLVAGQSYDIKLEYANNTGPATAELLWSSASTPQAAVPATQLFPSGGWLDTNLATAGGSVSSNGTAFTVQGAGAFGATADGGHFVYQSLTGDGTIVAQVTGGAGQAGLMIRDGLAGNGMEAALFLAADGVHFESRTAAGATATDTVASGVTGSTWLKLVRNGNFITGYSSPTGADNSWTLVGTATLSLDTTVDYGFAAAGGTATITSPAVTSIVPIGANVPPVDDWDLNNDFVDMFKQARTFYSVANSTNGTLVPASVDANGWPTEDFIAFLQTGTLNTAHIYNGTYKLSFTGQANVDTFITPGGSVQDLVYNAKTNTTTADVILNASDTNADWYFTLRFTNTNGSVKNVQLIRPGYDPANHPVFTSQFLATLAPFTTLRTMQFTQTIDNPVVNWADRAQVTDATQTSAKGVAWEYVIDLANEANKDIWINIPYGATDDYVRQLATLLKTNLNPDRVVYVELSNEIWNSAYSETQANLNAAVAEVEAGLASGHPSNLMLPGENVKNADGSWTYQWEWAYRLQARRTEQISAIFASVWGADAINGRVRIVLATQLANPYLGQTQLTWLNQTFGAPGNYLYAISGAPYFNLGTADQQTNLTSAQVLSALSAGIDAVASSEQQYSSLADQYGLKLVAYEAGPDTFGPNNIAAKAAASMDPQMENLVVQELDQWFGAGGGLIAWFESGATDYNTQYGTWGVTDAIDNLNSPKMQGIEQVEADGLPTAMAGTAALGTIPAIQYVGSTDTTDPYPRYLHNGATLDYLVSSPANAPYTLTLNYAEVTAGGQVQVWVNGVAVETLTLLVTGPDYDSNWAPDDFANSQAIPLTLQAGVNDVRLEVVSEGFTINSLNFAGASQPGTPAPPVNVAQPPTVATAAHVTTGPVTGTTAGLSVLGADAAGESSLTYTWSVVGTPPDAVYFSANGSNAAKSTTAYFNRSGAYTLQVTITDATGLTATSTVSVTVISKLSAMTFAPVSPTLGAGAAAQLTPTVYDQFGLAQPTPAGLTWTVTGTGKAGTVSSTGMYTASAAGGSTDTITATTGAISASAKVTIAPAVVVAPPISSGISYVTGFSTVGLATNGYAAIRSGRLRLTSGGFQRGSAFFQTPVGISRFSTAFDLQISNPDGDGLAFVLQGNSPTALGAGAGGLGYTSIAKSLAVMFDVTGSAGVGPNMVGLSINGGTPFGPTLNLTAAGINLRSGHELRTVVSYDGQTLTVSVTDVATGKSAQLSTAVNIANLVGGTTAYAGFTAATGGASSTQDVLDWTFTTIPAAQRIAKAALVRR
jgi:hypothetical protein